ncbi:MAG: sensor histidine kinase, partial [Coprobacillus cateniformis]
SLSHTMMDLLSLNETTPALCAVCIEDIIAALKKYYDGVDCSCQIKFICASSTVLSNKELLFTMLRNLIDNAIKASCDQQLVLVKGVVYEQMYQFSIMDQGIGMSEKDIAMALEPFYMADKSRTRKQGGAGLGLSIVKRILDIHHSHLDITSTPHKETTVSFMLEVIPHED